MSFIFNTITVAQTAATKSPSLSGIGAWLEKHWLLLLLIFIAIIIVFLLIFLVLIPALRKLIWRIKQAKETKKYSEELLLRKHLATVARGGEEGDEAELQALSSYIAEIKAELAYGKNVFKRERKNIYDIPWFFLLGEPGSGKSTLMRNSGLDMPANIVDFSQGESGTSTFHWWFAPDGVVLDVAGRILFNRWGGKGDTEWRYLINQAKKMRPNHPLNGIVVAIPADSLIADNPDLIKRKAKMLSDEIAVLQNSLGLSLPLYVVVSKMDCVVGFSDIFSELGDEERKRIFGWSGGGDFSFSPDELDDYFTSIHKDMSDYAATSMLSAEFSSGSGAERMQSVKDIYSFPDAFADLKGNLSLYMQTIFGVTNWSGRKSLLFRGVYFTSALDYGKRFEQGSETIPAQGERTESSQSLHASKPTFIHDLFSHKIFPEQGLARFLPEMLRKRRLPIVVAAAFVLIAAVFVGYFTITDSQKVKRDVSTLKKEWGPILLMFEKNQVAKSPAMKLDKNNNAVMLLLRPMEGRPDLSREEMLLALFKKSRTNLAIPPIYRFSQPWERIYSDNMMEHQRFRVLQLAYAYMLFLPSLAATRSQFITPPPNAPWSDVDTNALALLIRMEVAGKARKYYGDNNSDDDDYFMLSDMFEFLFNHNICKHVMTFLTNPEYKAALHREGKLYAVQNPNSNTFFMLQAGSRRAQLAITAGLNEFCAKWESCSADPEMLFHDVKSISSLLDEFRSVEGKLNGIQGKLTALGDTPSITEATGILDSWRSSFKELETVTAKLKNTQSELAYRADLNPDALLQETAYQFSLKMFKSYTQLQKLVSSDKQYVRRDKFLRNIKNKLIASIKKAENNSQSQLMAIDARMRAHLYDWTKQTYSDQKAYMDRFNLYAQLNERMNAKQSGVTLFSLVDKLAVARKMADDFKKSINEKKNQSKGDKYYASAISSVLAVFNLAYDMRRYQLYSDVLTKAPQSGKELAKLIANQSVTERMIPAPVFPLKPASKTGTFNNSFHPDAAKKYIDAWNELSVKLVTGKKCDRDVAGRNALLAEYAKSVNAISAYKRDYVKYWSQDIRNFAMFPSAASWPGFNEKIEGLKAYQVNGAIQYLSEQGIYALKNLKFTNVILKRSVAEGILFYQTQLSLLTGAFNKQSEACLISWQDIPTEQEDCCKYIMELTNEKISTTLFSVFSINNKTSLLWWNDFIQVATDALGSHITGYVMARTRQFAEVYRQFPLCNTLMREDSLSIAEVDTASIKLSQYLKLPPGAIMPTTAGKIKQKTAPKLKNNNKKILSLIRKIRPYYLLDDDSQRKWFFKLGTVLDVLKNKTNPLFWNIAVANNRIQKKVPEGVEYKDMLPAAEKYRFFEFYMDGVRLGNRTTTAYSDGLTHAIKDIYGYINASNITIAFFEFANSKQPGATLSFDGDWAPVNLYLRPGVTFDPKQKIHYIPLTFTDKQGDNCFYWIGLSFNGKTPMPSQWPTLNDWFSFDKKKIAEKRNINHQIYFLLQQGNFEKNKSDLVDAMRAAAPPGAVAAWEFYLPSVTRELRVPKIKKGGKRRSNQLNAPLYNANAKVPDTGASLMRYLQVRVDGKNVSERFQTMIPDINRTRSMHLLVPINSKNIEIQFFQYTDDVKPAKTIKLGSDYPIVNLLAKEGIVPENNKNGFLIPLRVQSGKNTDYYYWLGVRAANLYK
ncbi:MAG: hypothetical protein GXP32_09575 [Kiritimatiellaeota bacterium]|nr:hypothetical protein [Kiritimatiellota bacterium]